VRALVTTCGCVIALVGVLVCMGAFVSFCVVTGDCGCGDVGWCTEHWTLDGQSHLYFSAPTHQSHHIILTTKFNCRGKISGFYPNANTCDEYFICAGTLAFEARCSSGLLLFSTHEYSMKFFKLVTVNINIKEIFLMRQ
jgi:hypothetical protein